MSDMLAHLSNSRCGSKKVYGTEGVAARVAEERSEVSGEWILAYKCIDCTGWHIGHASTEQIVAAQTSQKRVHRCNNCGKPTNGTYCNRACRKEAKVKA